MIIDDKVSITLNSSNISRYKKLGYIGRVNETIDVFIKDLSNGSHALINIRCDICGIERKVKFNSIVKNDYLIKYYCKKCKNEKNLLEKYGVKNVFQIDNVKKKIKEKNLEKYGVDNVSKSIEIKEKKIKTNRINWGCDWGLSNDIIKNKSKKTIMDKYGVDNVSKNKNIKIKKEKTCFENNGVKYISQSIDFKQKIKNKVLNFLKNKYGIIDYVGDDYIFYCKKCNQNFSLNKRAYQTRRELKVELCSICNPIGYFSTSSEEKNIIDFIKKNYQFDVITNAKIIPPKEIDIYLPNLKIAFEFNGLYWHSEFYKDANYHLNKTEECEKLGIHLIHIYEDDWLYKQNIVKSRILNILGKSNKIYARKCEIKEITDNNMVKDFLELNHIQGFVGSKIKIGLFYNEEIVSLMTFGSLRIPMGQKSSISSFEMLRFCNKININVIGGASKLFKYFIEKYNPIEVISYADCSWSNGDLYKKLEFELIHKTKPNYYYIINKTRKYRFNFRKNKLITEGFDSTKTEHEIMLDRGILRIYDSGSLKFLWNKK